MKPLYVKKNGVVYKISGNGMPASYPAANVEYDNTVTSELQSTDVQGAIDELSTRQGGVQSDWNEDDNTELDYIKNKPQNLVQDASYVHTDNNYDNTAKGKVDALGTASTKDAGAANGVAELDAAGKVPSSQLPSFVDDVIEVADYAHLPITGESGKIYVTLDTNKTYRWSGSGYTEISESLALGETSSTAYRGDRGKTAYDHSQTTSGNPHNVTASEVGLGNVDNTSDSTKKTNFTGSIASGNTGFTTGGDVYTALQGKVNTETGKGLSTNDYTTDEKSAVATIPDKVDWLSNGILGSKNLIPYPYADGFKKVANGITFTVDENGVVTANGTATSNAWFYLTKELVLDNTETYILNGDLDDETTYNATAILFNENDESGASHWNYGKTTPVEFTPTYTIASLRIRITSGKTVNNQKFYPMIRLKADTDDSYYPPARTNLLLDRENYKKYSAYANGVMGAKNLIPYPWVNGSGSQNQVIFTDNNDGSITANGTASAVVNYSLITPASHKLYLKAGDYVLNGCPSGSAETYELLLVDTNGNNMNPRQYDVDVTITIPSDGYYGVKIVVRSGANVNAIYKPMLRLVSDTDSTFRPYAKTNKELTDEVASKSNVQASTTNGNIKIDSVETPVYRNYGNNAVLTTDKTSFLTRQTLNPTGFSGYVREKLIGASYAWNQLVNPSVQDVNNVSVTNTNGKYKLYGTANNAGGRNRTQADTIKLETNHVYAILFISIVGTPKASWFLTYQSGYNEIGNSIKLFKSSVSGNAVLGFNTTNGTSYDESYYLCICDLTLAFGSTIADYLYGLSGNGGITKLRDMGCPIDKYTDYGNYLVSSKTSGKRVTINQLGTLIRASRNAGTGGTASVNNRIITGDFYDLKAGTTYCIFGKTSTSGKTLKSSYSLWANKSTTNNTRTYDTGWITEFPIVITPTEDKIFTCTFAFTDDSAITLSELDAVFGGAVIYSLGNDELRGMFDVINGEIVADGDVKESNGNLTRNYGIYTFTGDEGGTVFTTYFAYSNLPSTLGIKTNTIKIISSNGLTPLRSGVAETAMSVSVGGALNININNVGADVKAAMAGKTIIFEKTTPTTEQSTPFADPMSLVGATTEEYIDDRTIPCPVGAERQYMGQSEDVVEIPSSPQSDGERYLKAITSGGQTQYILEKLRTIKTGTFRVALTANTWKDVSTTSDIIDGTLPDNFQNCMYLPITYSNTWATLMTFGAGSKTAMRIYTDTTNSRVGIRWIQIDDY